MDTLQHILKSAYELTLMEEVVYQFLLQTAGYPRASIISDTSLVFKTSDGRPAYLIVDPDTAEPLAVIHVVGAVDASGLYAAAHAAEANKAELNRSTVQGFVVRIDFRGRTDKEKIQFYQTKAEGELYPLSASTFPDIQSLRVGSKLHSALQGRSGITNQNFSDKTLAAVGNISTPDVSDELLDEDKKQGFGLGGWLGCLLVLLVIADTTLNGLTGNSWIQPSHAIMLVGASFLFLVGRRLRKAA